MKICIEINVVRCNLNAETCGGLVGYIKITRKFVFKRKINQERYNDRGDLLFSEILR